MGLNDVSRGNARVHKAAKAAAISQDALLISQCDLTPTATMPSLDDVITSQVAVSTAE